MNHLPSPRRDLNRRGGFTLLEVVIALAIFVFGALAIVRIFPPALGIIQNSGDQLVAVNLNRTTLARLAQTPQIVPDALYDTTAEEAVTNWRTPEMGSVVGTGRRNNSIPVENIQDYDKSALGHFKNVAGERHIVSADGTVLTQFPYEDGTVKVYEEEALSGVVLEGAGTLNFDNARIVSTNTSFTPVAASNDRVYVSYQWVENGRVWSATDEPLDYSTLTNPKVSQTGRTSPMFSTTPGGPLYLISGEVKARLRRASTITPVTPVPEDPYLGLVTLGAAAGGKKIVLDYTVKDWRWLVQDGSPTIDIGPLPGMTKPRAVRLSAPPLDNTLGEENLYALVRNNTSPPSYQAPVQGLSLGKNLDDKKGLVPLETDTLTAPTSRISYRSIDNWAQQLSVAPPNYKLFYGRTPDVDDWEYWRNCVYLGDNCIYFNASEAGKTVLLSYSYGDSSLGASTDTIVKSRIMTIDEQIIGKPTTTLPVQPFPTNFANSGRVSRLQLTDLDGNLLGGTKSLTSIKSIQGISIQARTAWLNGDRFTQTLATNYRGASNP